MPPIERFTIETAAEFSPCGKYRYWLSRSWNDKGIQGVFICLNPSKASAHYTDQTIANCHNLAALWGWGGFKVLNLYAYMATQQTDLKARKNAIGKHNDKFIRQMAAEADIVVLAWGNGYRQRAAQVMALLQERPLHCIRRNAGGGFLHPNRINFKDYPQPVKLVQ